MTEDCKKSIELLSHYLAGTLDEVDRDLVYAHLMKCLPCKGVMQDLDSIVNIAVELREEMFITFPDENVIWQRINGSRSASS
jgi:predicted anti-sigma-YlaC factor YlaD